MKGPRTAALALIVAGCLSPARAAETGPGGDLALQVRLTAVPGSVSAVVLEAETVFGFELDGHVTWTVDGQRIVQEQLLTRGGVYLDVQVLPLAEAALVCAHVGGRLELAPDLGRPVAESECLLWLPSEEQPASTGHRRVVLEERKRRPGVAPVLQ